MLSYSVGYSIAKGHDSGSGVMASELVVVPGLEPGTSSLSGLLRDLAYVRQARSRCLDGCPGVAVMALGGPPHRARGGHGARRPGARRLLVLARTRHPSLGAHPLAVGHPPGSGLGPAGEGGAHHRLNDLRPRSQVCWACPGRWREGESPPQPNGDSGRSWTSRSILEPEANERGVGFPLADAGQIRPRPLRWCMKWPPRDLFPFKQELPLLSIQPH